MRREYTKEGLLPSGYRQLEYLQSTGTQYIDTGYVPKINTIWELDSQFLVIENNRSNGVFQYDGNLRFHISIYRGYYHFGLNGTAWTNVQTADTNRHLFTLNAVNSCCTIDENVYDLNNGNTPPYLPIWLFQEHNNNYSIMRLYGTRMYEDSELKRNLIPALRTSDSKPGLYDIVNNVFYTNQGTGEFLYA